MFTIQGIFGKFKSSLGVLIPWKLDFVVVADEGGEDPSTPAIVIQAALADIRFHPMIALGADNRSAALARPGVFREAATRMAPEAIAQYRVGPHLYRHHLII